MVKEDIINLPRPAPIPKRNLVEYFQNLEEPIIINNTKIYEPFCQNIWKNLKTQPLTALKLKLSKPKLMENIINK